MKFHLDYRYDSQFEDDSQFDDDPQFDAKILFATRKHVEELYLSSYWHENCLFLPQLLFNSAPSLVKLTAYNFILKPDRKVNWGCLTTLELYDCGLNDQGLQHILSGSPLLESLELINCSDFHDKLKIASKCLKKLVLRHDIAYGAISAIEISCPNLLELSLVGVDVEGDVNLFAQAFANVLSTCPLLESFELTEIYCSPLHNLVIASKSLKRLVLGLNDDILNLHVTCPQLELFELSGNFNLTTAKLHDLPSSLCASFDFRYYEKHNSNKSTLVQDILQQVHHVKKLTIGHLFIKILSTLVVGDRFPFVLNVKNLTIKSPNLNKHYSGIARLLRHAPELEKLVINEPIYDQTELERMDDFGENFWNPDAVVFNCLVSHLKTVRIIIGLPKRHEELKCLISFVQFLLNNARVLEKMVLVKLFRLNFPIMNWYTCLDVQMPLLRLQYLNRILGYKC